MFLIKNLHIYQPIVYYIGKVSESNLTWFKENKAFEQTKRLFVIYYLYRISL